MKIPFRKTPGNGALTSMQTLFIIAVGVSQMLLTQAYLKNEYGDDDRINLDKSLSQITQTNLIAIAIMATSYPFLCWLIPKIVDILKKGKPPQETGMSEKSKKNMLYIFHIVQSIITLLMLNVAIPYRYYFCAIIPSDNDSDISEIQADVTDYAIKASLLLFLYCSLLFLSSTYPPPAAIDSLKNAVKIRVMHLGLKMAKIIIMRDKAC